MYVPEYSFFNPNNSVPGSPIHLTSSDSELDASHETWFLE